MGGLVGACCQLAETETQAVGLVGVRSILGICKFYGSVVIDLGFEGLALELHCPVVLCPIEASRPSYY